MSYKTNAIGNRLGISFGWKTDVYPSFSLYHYGSSVKNAVKLYFFVKEYLNKKDIVLITYNYRRKNTLYFLFLSIYKYQKSFNLEKRKYDVLKKKVLTSIQSDRMAYRKQTKRRFITQLKLGYKKLRTNLGWRSTKDSDLKFKMINIVLWRRWVEHIKKTIHKLPIHFKRKLKAFIRNHPKLRGRNARIKGWTFRINKVNRFLKITKIRNECIYFEKVSKKLRFRRIKNRVKIHQLCFFNNTRKIRVLHPEYYNNFLSIAALRNKLRSFLQSKKFNIENINITEPIKTANKKSIKLYSEAHWYRRIQNQKFFINTIRLLHLMEKFANPALLADHFARELLKIRKKHWHLITAFSKILKYWRLHRAIILKKQELERNKGRDFKTKQIKSKKWIPRYKLYSGHDRKKTIKGLKMNIRGKINASDRTRLKVIREGIIPLQSFNQNVIYALAHARVKTGAFGIKVWLFT